MTFETVENGEQIQDFPVRGARILVAALLEVGWPNDLARIFSFVFFKIGILKELRICRSAKSVI
jgi:hypothetical protein